MGRSDVLVDADWVEAHIDDPQVAIVEVDEDTSAYEKNHMKNAIRIDWTKDLQDPVRRDFVDQAGFEKLLSEKGIANDTLVVLYGGNNNWFASYAYWYFKLYGHENVKLLDGGRKKWELDSRDLTDAVPTRPATQYTAKPQDESIRAYRDDVVKAIGNQNLVDVRSPDEFSGKLLAPAISRRSSRSAPAMCRAPATSRGRRTPTTTAPSSRTRSSRPSTRPSRSTCRRTPSRTAASVSVPCSPGSCSTSSWARRTSRTTTAPGPSTAPSSACRSSSAPPSNPPDQHRFDPKDRTPCVEHRPAAPTPRRSSPVRPPSRAA
ncbi:hypothetical protein SCALM49S_02906 [Streptomyces californicus]